MWAAFGIHEEDANLDVPVHTYLIGIFRSKEEAMETLKSAQIEDNWEIKAIEVSKVYDYDWSNSDD